MSWTSLFLFLTGKECKPTSVWLHPEELILKVKQKVLLLHKYWQSKQHTRELSRVFKRCHINTTKTQVTYGKPVNTRYINSTRGTSSTYIYNLMLIEQTNEAYWWIFSFSSPLTDEMDQQAHALNVYISMWCTWGRSSHPDAERICVMQKQTIWLSKSTHWTYLYVMQMRQIGSFRCWTYLIIYVLQKQITWTI